MKKQILIISLISWRVALFSQHSYELNLKGSELFIQPGANLYVQGDVWLQDSTANLDNDGVLELQGDWYMRGGAKQLGSMGRVRFRNHQINQNQPQKIDGNCSSVLTVGDAAFYELEIDNDDGGSGLVYLDNGNTAVNQSVIFTNGRIRTNPTVASNGDAYQYIFEMLNPSADLGSFAGIEADSSTLDQRYIEGKLLRRLAPTGGRYDFPIGLKPNSQPGTAEGLQNIAFEFQSDAYQSVTAWFRRYSPNEIAGDPIECDSFRINCFAGKDHGEWIVSSSASNSVIESYNVIIYPQNYTLSCDTYPDKYFITKDDTIAGLLNECYYNPVGLRRSEFQGFSEFGFAAITDIILPNLEISLNTEPFNKHISVTWQLSSETSVAQYELERSTDGSDFTLIHKKESIPNSSIGNHLYEDNQVIEGITYYYRLRVILQDGSFQYSQLVEVQILPRNFLNIHLYPNPSFGQLWLDIKSGTSTSTFISIYTLLGQEVYQQNMVISQGKNTIRLPLRHLKAGSYLLFLKSNTHQSVWKKFLITK